MHGIGNDFVLIDARAGSVTDDSAELARNVCDRKFGVGADGLIFLEEGDLAPLRMRMLNPDGSESENCGNGLRCVAKLVGTSQRLDIETGGRAVEAELLADGRIRVDMGYARVLDPNLHSGGHVGVSIDLGNPHFVVFVEDVASIDLESLGPKLEHAAEFPYRTNVHFVQVVDRGHAIQRTWERGAGVTLACGSGACAVGVAAFVSGRTGSSATLRLPGGELEIETNEAGQVWMTGPAEVVFYGKLPT
jgi:diaminopimelate epimerase